MRHPILFAGILLAGLLSAGCGKSTTVVLIPDPSGEVGEVTVANPEGQQVLTRPGQTAEVARNSAPGTTYTMKKETIEKTFGSALKAAPARPVHHLLYFKSDSTNLTPKSKQLFPTIISSIEKRRSTDISVVGHTDTLGDKKYNMALSLSRARKVAKILVSRGVKKANLEVTSHGEANLLIITRDGVSERRNRRVEVVVR